MNALVKRRVTLQIAAAALAVALLVVLFRLLPIAEWLARFVEWIAGLGWIGVVVFILVYILAAVTLAPAVVLTIGAGAIFGVVKGVMVVSVGATLGAAAAFLIGRYVARQRVERWTESNKKFRAIDQAVGREGWKIVLLTRLSPAFPYNLQNYFYGLTAVGFWPYLLATWIGMLPVIFVYTYIGFAGRTAASVVSGKAETTTQQYWFWGFGLAATIAATLFVTRIARKALRQRGGE